MAYVYQAALLCDDCGLAKQKALLGTVHPSKDYDSDRFPQGPYADGGGEADSPQHCDHCGEFLENSLTGDGEEYVRDLIAQHHATGRGSESVLRQWSEFYGIAFDPEIDPDKVWNVHLSDDGGVSSYAVTSTRAGADSLVAGYVTKYWHPEFDYMPDDPDDRVYLFYYIAADRGDAWWYDITPCMVDGGLSGPR